MIAFPNAKINLGLNILQKRSDGFHEIETLMYPVPIHDVLEIVPGHPRQESISLYGMNIPGETAGNLCLTAMRQFAGHHPVSGYQMHLFKNIPIGAGLGGGSADAAFTLKLLNQISEAGFGQEELAHMASKIGSDCPFFIFNRPMLARGRGEILEPLSSFSLKGMRLWLVVPPIHIGTADAYAGVLPMVQKECLASALAQTIDQWRGSISNGFEKSIFSRYPDLGRIKDTLYTFGAVYASMSGSGSAVYGIFRDSDASPPPSAFPGCRVYTPLLS